MIVSWTGNEQWESRKSRLQLKDESNRRAWVAALAPSERRGPFGHQGDQALTHWTTQAFYPLTNNQLQPKSTQPAFIFMNTL